MRKSRRAVFAPKIFIHYRSSSPLRPVSRRCTRAKRRWVRERGEEAKSDVDVSSREFSSTQMGNSRYFFFSTFEHVRGSQLRSFACFLRGLSSHSSRALMLRRRKRRERQTRWESQCGDVNGKGFSYLIHDKNNYVAWCCYLHSEFKPIIAIKFAIKYRIKIENSPLAQWRLRREFSLWKSLYFSGTQNILRVIMKYFY